MKIQTRARLHAVAALAVQAILLWSGVYLSLSTLALTFIGMVIFMVARSHLIFEIRVAELMRLPPLADELIRQNKPWRPIYARLEKDGAHFGPWLTQALDLTKWTREQFYPTNSRGDR